MASRDLRTWVQRRWLDFRNGHSVYLSFALTFINFTVITFTLAVARIPELHTLFPSMTEWTLFFFVVYLPAAIVAGHLHMKKQVPKEQEQIMEINPYAYKTSPGIQQKYGFPVSVISYNLQLKQMQILNEIGEAFKKSHDIHITKWTEMDVKKVEWMREVAARLQTGEHIETILKELPEPSG